jgi:esterase/lipase superfamily enzyme
VVVTEGLADPFGGAAERSTTLPIFFATDRETIDPAVCKYGDEFGDALRLGVAQVQFGDPGWSFDQLVGRSKAGERVNLGCLAADDFGRLWTTISPVLAADFEAASASTSDDDPIRGPALRFAKAVDAHLAKSEQPDVYIFVSGFNTTFAETVERIGQFAYFQGNDGAFLAYSWPTRLSVWGYVADSQKAALSVRNLRRLVLFLGTHTRAGQIHLIGYSAGAQILAQALLEIRLMHWEEDAETLRSKLRIGRVLYPAADLDLRYARNLKMDGFDDLAEESAVYVSSGDLGIWASAAFFTKATRLGRPDRDLTEADLESLRENPEGNFIDADAAIRHAGGDFAGHGYWYSNPWVNTDVILFLRYGLTPGERGLVRSEDGTRWVFPENYPQRLRCVVNRLRRDHGLLELPPASE